jgi:hypothetical protein
MIRMLCNKGSFFCFEFAVIIESLSEVQRITMTTLAQCAAFEENVIPIEDNVKKQQRSVQYSF